MEYKQLGRKGRSLLWGQGELSRPTNTRHHRPFFRSHQRALVLDLMFPGQGQSFPHQNLVDTLSIPSVDVVQDAAIIVSLSRPKLYTHRVSGQLPEPVCCFIVARLTTFRGIHAKEPDGGVGADKGIPVNDR